jgi:hypothetical protein
MLDKLQSLIRGGSPAQVFTSILIAAAAYILALLFYRAFLHPLANVPGPKLAGLTYWYEFYYDCWIGGRYMFRQKELHEQHGHISKPPSRAARK